MQHGFDMGRIRLVECCELVKKSSLDNLSEELRMLEKMTQVQSEICLRMLILSKSVVKLQILLGAAAWSFCRPVSICGGTSKRRLLHSKGVKL